MPISIQISPRLPGEYFFDFDRHPVWPDQLQFRFGRFMIFLEGSAQRKALAAQSRLFAAWLDGEVEGPFSGLDGKVLCRGTP